MTGPTSPNTSSGSSDTKCETVDLAPYRRMVRTRGRPVPRGRWPSPATLQLDPEQRAARRFLRPSACGELQTTGKPRTVGRVGSDQFTRSPLRSRVYDLSRARAARPARTHAAGV